MSKTFSIGVVGARGHTGRELLRLIAGHPALELAFASSREFEGRLIAKVAPEMMTDMRFEALGPDEAAARGADVIVLALPDGAGAPFVEAVDASGSEAIIVDLSADKRFDDGWAYGLPELHRAAIKGAKRIANPGCYATAMQLCVAPMLPLLAEDPVVFGVSGYSGAGTTPNPRNDPERLADNFMPYALIGHKHEREASRHLGRAVRFSPNVVPAFRGLTTTAHLAFSGSVDAGAFRARYEAAYGDDPLIALQDEAPELKDGTGRTGAVIGGFAVAADGRRGVVVAAEDNLLKGAAVQAIQNVNIALGLGELDGLS